MKFVCDRCQTRYSIADEKVRQKILRIRCKTCGNVLVVQDERERGSAAAEHRPPEPARPAQTGAPKAVPSSGPKAVPSSGPKAVPSSGPKAPPPLPPRGKGADPLGGHVEWYVAINGERSGPFSRVEVAKRIHAAGPHKTVHVWKEGMAGWKTPDEVSVVARELSLLRPALPPPPRAAGTPSPPTAKPTAPATPSAPAKPVAPEFEDTTATTIDTGGFGEVTTKKGKELVGQLVTPVGAEFEESTTKKSKDLVEVVAKPTAASYTEATTKKGKNLHELEADTPTTPGVGLGESDRTPPPLKPLPPVGGKVAAVVPTAPSMPAVPMPAPVVAFDIPAGAPPPRPSSSMSIPGLAHARTPPPFVLPGTPLGPAAPPFKMPGSLTPPAVPVRAPLASLASGPTAPQAPFVAPVAPLGSASSAPSAPFAVAATAPGALSLPGDLPTPRPIGVGPFAVPPSPPLSPDMQVTPGGLAGLLQRQPGLKYVFAVLAIVGLIILLGLVILRGGERQPRPEPAPAASAPVEPPKAPEPKPAAAEPPAPPPPAVEKPAPVAPRSGKPTSGRSGHRGSRVAERERPPREKAPAKPPRLAGARPNPFDEAKSVSQSQITAVVRNPGNQAALKSCYERALKMDNHLTSGRIDVTVSINSTGSVQRVVINAPSSFILVEPCIKGAVKRWVFPASTEDYATNFPLIMQGGM